MTTKTLQPLIWVGVTAAAVIATITTLSLLDDGAAEHSRPDAAAPTLTPPSRDAAPSSRGPTPRAFIDAARIDATATSPKPAAERKRRALELYRDQVDEDRAQLGSEFAELDKLWKKGRFGGGSKGAVDALEELVERFGDTHHATCARYMLAKHAMLKGAGKPAQRREQTGAALEALSESAGDSRCDSGAQVGNLSKFFLATQVYRHDDFERSVELLEELAEIDNDEVDSLDVPISLRARGILQEVEEQRR